MAPSRLALRTLLLGLAVLATAGESRAGERPRPNLDEHTRKVLTVLGHLSTTFPEAQLVLLSRQFVAEAEVPAEPEVADFWLNRGRGSATAAAQVVAMPSPLEVLSLRLGGQRMVVWDEQEPVPDLAPPLNPDWLASIRDRKALPDFRGRAPDELTKEEVDEMKVYCQAVKMAAETPPEAFAKSAAVNDKVTWGHLFREPSKYRGEVIHVKGRLKRLRREDAPLELQKEWIKHLYEGWVFMETHGSNPVCVIFAKLPAGLNEGENLDHEVSFDGYFFKRYRYISGKGPRETLLFMAPTLKVLSSPAGTEPSFTRIMPSSLVTGLMVLIVGTLALVLGMGWWFRRNDRLVRAKLPTLQPRLPGEEELDDEDSPPLATAFRPEEETGFAEGPSPRTKASREEDQDRFPEEGRGHGRP